MKFSQLITKTSKTVSEQTESVNAQLLLRAGFIYQEMAGVYVFLPLGLRVIKNIENMVREEMDKLGTEILLPALSSRDRWHATKRHDTVDVLMSTKAANEAAMAKHSGEYILNPTHEDLIAPVAKSFRTSYKDFPFAVYQIQTKFRNEPRAKSGLLRGREFIMKDLYSFHVSEESLKDFYELAKERYTKVYERLGLGESTFLTLASGGDFTHEYSHEFQTLLETGEDTIYLDRKNKIAYNKEVTTPEDAKKLKVDFDSLEKIAASEVGNIFPLGTKYSELLDYFYTDENNERKLVWMGSYGIGISRLMGVIAEKFADDKGLVWPTAVTPFQYHLVALLKDVDAQAVQKLYSTLGEDNCLLDDRVDVGAGEKFADADLIGCPVQVVISKKSLDQDSVEVTSRTGIFKTYLCKLSDVKTIQKHLTA